MPGKLTSPMSSLYHENPPSELTYVPFLAKLVAISLGKPVPEGGLGGHATWRKFCMGAENQKGDPY